MSRWLSSVNNLLDNLDGKAEAVAETGVTYKYPIDNDDDDDDDDFTTDDDEDNYDTGAGLHVNDAAEDDDDDFDSNYDDGDGGIIDDPTIIPTSTTTTNNNNTTAANTNTADEVSGTTAIIMPLTSTNLSQNDDAATSLASPSSMMTESRVRQTEDRKRSPADTDEPRTQQRFEKQEGMQSPRVSKKICATDSNNYTATVGTNYAVNRNVVNDDSDEVGIVLQSQQRQERNGNTHNQERQAVDPDNLLPSSTISISTSTMVGTKQQEKYQQPETTTINAIPIENPTTNEPIGIKNKNQAVPIITKETMTATNRGVSASDNVTPSTSSNGENKIGMVNRKQHDPKELQLQKQKHHEHMLSSKMKTIQSLQSKLSATQGELSKGKAASQQLQQRVALLEERLQTSEHEVEAQAEELRRAGDDIRQLRSRTKEEREDLFDDHDDEILDIQRENQIQVDRLREEYERTIAEWKDRFESEESLRQKQGEEFDKELRDAHRIKIDALEKLDDVMVTKNSLQARLDVVEKEAKATLESADAISATEKRAREELDKALTMHAKQMAQRQRREAELEQNILNLGSALTAAGSTQDTPPQQYQQNNSTKKLHDFDYKEKSEQITEELETVKVELTMESQRREALQQQLNEVSNERKEEISISQSRQHQHDQKIAHLESTIHRLQASVRSFQSEQQQQQQQQSGNSADYDGYTTTIDDNVLNNNNDQNARGRPFQKDFESTKQEIAKLSEQLIRQRDHAENAKSEILTLRGRLRAANIRADEAEKAHFDSQNTMIVSSRSSPLSRAYDMESGKVGGGGGSSANGKLMLTRRRIKGGFRGNVRSIRSVLPCLSHVGGRVTADGGATEQVARTIDAIDSWMVSTGSFMRHEPFARLVLLLYFIVLHCWSFALVVFHTTTEVEHGDFGSMDSNPRHWRDHAVGT